MKERIDKISVILSMIFRAILAIPFAMFLIALALIAPRKIEVLRVNGKVVGINTSWKMSELWSRK